MPEPPVRLPLPSGKQLSIAQIQGRFTEDERKHLETAESTAPAEEDMDRAVRSFMEADEARSRLELPVKPDHRIELSDEDLRPIESLSAEEREDIRRKIAEVQQVGREFARTSLSPQQATVPGLADAVDAAESEFHNVMQSEGDEELPDTGTKPIAKVCPRCRFDMTKTEVVEPTREDRYAWLASLFGARFRKSYLLYGGQVRISFRSLTTAETNLTHDQTLHDLASRSDAGLPAYMDWLFSYRMALSLESIELADSRKLVVPADRFLEAKTGSGDDNRLKGLLQYVRTHILRSESLNRVVTRKFQEFQRLIEWMEADEDRDFTTEISGPS